MDITEFPIPTSQLVSVLPTKQPNTGLYTFNVARMATGGVGTYANPWTGWDTAIAAYFGPNREFFFPSGVYGYSSSPNFGIHGNVRYRGEQGAVLKYTGSGTAFNLDGSTTPAQQTGVNCAFGITVTDLIIDGTGSGATGIYAEAIHHSIFRNVFVRDVTGKGFHFRWNILNVFHTLHATTRVGEADGTGESDALGIGFYFDNDGDPINAVQGCTMINLIAELCAGVGIHLQGANENTFIGGSSEQNTGKNMVIYGHGNTVIGMDNEFSGDADEEDFYIGGNHNKLINCLGTGTVRIGNDVDGADYIGNEIIGGRFNKIIVDTNAQHTIVSKPAYNFSGDGSFRNNSNSTIVTGAAFDLLAETANPLKLDIPGHAVVRGDVEILDDHGLIIRSPDGTRYRIIVANGGSLSTEVATVDLGLAESDAFGSAKTQWVKDSFVTTLPSSAVTVALVSNQLSITLPNSTAGNNFGGYANNPHEIVSGGYERIHYIAKPSAGSFQFRFSIGNSKQNCLYMGVDSGTLVFVSIAGGSATSVASIAFNTTTMQYWRLRRSTNDIVAEYSTDGSAWTTLGTATPTQFDFANYRTCIEAGSTGSSTFDSAVIFDDYVYFRG